ncbi:bis-tetraphosphatase [Aureobasidium sp. EXF-12298]|nr:bis-tetraphosphatase [Aureobasidium sp. EXF-12298]
MTSNTKAEMPPSTLSKAIKFGPFTVTSQVFYKTPLSYCLVNLKPLLPGHILVCPLRPVQHLSSLTAPEVSDLFSTVQLCSITLKRVFGASACNIAIQDGVAAGQSVPHVHCHLIPRKGKDMDEQGGGDKIYEQLEGEEGDIGQWQRRGERQGKFPKVEDEERKPRSMEEMEKEARWLAEEILKDVKAASNGSSL